MTDNIVQLRDPNRIIRAAVANLQRVLAVYAEPSGPDAKRTISELMVYSTTPQSCRRWRRREPHTHCRG